MNEQQIAAVKQGIESLEEATTFTGAWPNGRKAITALKRILADQAERNCKNCVIDKPCSAKGKDMQPCGAFISNQSKQARSDALDKMAENARELGLDYEPVAIERTCPTCKYHTHPNGKFWCNGCGGPNLFAWEPIDAHPHPANQVAEPRNMGEPADDLDYKDLYEQVCEQYDVLAKELEQQPADEPVAWMDREGDVYKKEPPENWCPPHTALYARPQTAAKVSPLEFVTMVLEKEHLVGKPLVWAEWPNAEGDDE